jgi:RHS repeat-associated protein
VKDSADRLVATFVYNERNQRIKKINYNAGTPSITTWYIVDATGRELSIYDNSSGSTAQTEMPLYGSNRLGVVEKNGATLAYIYELKDHLGNVRVTVDRNKVLQSWIDYLAFGEVNPERHAFSAYTRRSEYQGESAQYDAETEWNSFDLRMYDARIGRWLSVDPYGQHWSPYEGMGNNPAMFIDPTGGEDENHMINLPEVTVTGTRSITNIPSIVLGLNYQNGTNPLAGLRLDYDADDIRSIGNIRLPGGVDYSAVYIPKSKLTGTTNESDFWRTHMGRDLISMKEYFTNTEELRELNDAVSTVANGGKVLGLGMMAFGLTSTTGVFIAELSGTVSTVTDGADVLLDLAEGKFTSAGVKSSFFVISLTTGGIISRSMYGGTAQTVTSTVSDMVTSGLQNMATSQMDKE